MDLTALADMAEKVATPSIDNLRSMGCELHDLGVEAVPEIDQEQTPSQKSEIWRAGSQV